MKTFLNTSIVIVLYLLVFCLAELLYRKGLPAYITRKIVHVGSGIVSSLLPFFVNLETAMILGLVFSLLLLVSKRKKLLDSIHKTEDDSVGALLFAPSLILTAIIFWPINVLIFQGASLILGFSDGIAGIVGKQYGKMFYKITGIKTIEGSMVFFLVTSLLLLGILYANGALTPSSIFFSFGGSFLLTVIEAIFGKGWDNLFIPIVSGVILYFIL